MNFGAGALFAAISALLFGVSTPLAKRLLGEGATPQLLAGLFYLGSGLGLAVLLSVRRALGIKSPEAPFRRGNLPRLGLAIALGGVLAPALLMWGLSASSASSASLLLNLEGVATMAIAWVMFRESVDARLLLGAAAIVLGAAILSWSGGFTMSLGSLAIIGACLCWGMDNNVTRGLSAADPVHIALAKGLVAGLTNSLLALAVGARLPVWPTIAAAGVIGFFCFGVSLVLFVRALRELGAARTSAYYSTAPFLGAVVAMLMFHESLSARLLLAGALMGLGVYLHLIEAHQHQHSHEELCHEHRHVHDAHHQHHHDPGEVVSEPHSHWHRHAPLTHSHAHFPDLHHRHGHSHGPKD
jgi:drug/metabolite transporter (DMT)-like permease